MFWTHFEVTPEQIQTFITETLIFTVEWLSEPNCQAIDIIHVLCTI
jgi:hypothetical protein